MSGEDFADDALTRDAFLGGRLAILQPREGYRAATDPVLLAAAVPARTGEPVLELGCGAGVASLCLACRVPGVRPTGLDLQPAYAALAARNAALNRVEMRVETGDVADPPAALRAESFVHVFMNPPYFPAGDGTPAQDAGRERGRREAVPLAAWIDTGIRRLAPRGTLTVIQRADRLPEMLAALDGRMGSVAVLPLAPRAGRAAGRVILQAVKGGRAPFRLAAPLVLHRGEAHEADADSHTRTVSEILRNGAALCI